MFSLVSSLTPNNLIPFTIYLSFVYLSFRVSTTTSVLFLLKISGFLPDLKNWHPFGLAEIRLFRIVKIGTHQDWQN